MGTISNIKGVYLKEMIAIVALFVLVATANFTVEPAPTLNLSGNPALPSQAGTLSINFNNIVGQTQPNSELLWESTELISMECLLFLLLKLPELLFKLFSMEINARVVLMCCSSV